MVSPPPYPRAYDQCAVTQNHDTALCGRGTCAHVHFLTAVSQVA